MRQLTVSQTCNQNNCDNRDRFFSPTDSNTIETFEQPPPQPWPDQITVSVSHYLPRQLLISAHPIKGSWKPLLNLVIFSLWKKKKNKTIKRNKFQVKGCRVHTLQIPPDEIDIGYGHPCFYLTGLPHIPHQHHYSINKSFQERRWQYEVHWIIFQSSGFDHSCFDYFCPTEKILSRIIRTAILEKP